MATELNRMGGIVEEKPDGLLIQGQGRLKAAECKTYGDHRVAMSLAVAGMAQSGATLDDAGCVNISFPGFFDLMKGCCK